MLGEVGDNFKERFTMLEERFTKFETADYYHGKTLDSIKAEVQTVGHTVTGLDAKLSDLDERVTRLETVGRFHQTIHRIGYRPEIKRMEPVPGTNAQEWQPTSPYRR
jgi:hypothetical protein